jgi:cell division protein FtsI (penicillin-binding protein 3)
MRFAHTFKTNAPAAPRLPRLRAPLVFGGLLLLFVGLLGRSLYLQRIDNGFLQEQGSSRYSRDIEVPAHRGRIVDRFGDPLAISTPVKAVWAWPDQVDATPDQLKTLAAALDLPTAALKHKLAQGGDFVYLKKPVAPQAAAHIAALKIDGIHDENDYWRYYPGGEVMSQIVGFTGDRDVGQEGIELAQQSWLGGHPGSRRVIINRRGEIVEDVASIRAPQEGRDLALSIDSRLQYLAFRELKAAVELNKARAGALVMLDAKTGEILALANWPAFNPNNRQRTARDHMRNRALIDTFEPGSTLKPFTVGESANDHRHRPGHADDRSRDDSRCASRRCVDGRAGDSEVLQCRRGEDRAVAAGGNDVADAFGGGLRRAAADRVPRRSIGPAARGEDVAADRAGDDGVRPRHLGQSGATRARLHRVRQRR